MDKMHKIYIELAVEGRAIMDEKLRKEEY